MRPSTYEKLYESILCDPHIDSDEMEEILEEVKYKKGFDILMKWWHCIPEDEVHIVDKELKEVGL